jgi:flagellar basal-body rod modification protein FlgD
VATGIFNHAVTAGQALTGKAATPTANDAAGTTGTSNTNSSSGASSNSATISANDFLTLLVTEMQNQDPTATTDPNEYINQLVNVNSLEQLIGINQTLTTDLGPPPSSTGNGATGKDAGTTTGPAGTSAPAAAAAANRAHAPGAAPAASSAISTGSTSATQATAGVRAPGNLSVPRANAAAQRVAHALDGRTHAQSPSGAKFAAQ